MSDHNLISCCAQQQGTVKLVTLLRSWRCAAYHLPLSIWTLTVAAPDCPIPPAYIALVCTSNSLIVPVHMHPSLGQTAAKASTSLRAALSGKACMEKPRLLSVVIWFVSSVTVLRAVLQTLCISLLRIRMLGAHSLSLGCNFSSPYGHSRDTGL